MIDQRFVILGALFSFGTVLVYIRDTLNGRTQPNRVTWLLWGLAPMLAFAAELKDHVGLGSLMTFSVGFNPLLVLVASFVNPHGSWRIGRFDYLCGGLSILGTVAWIVTSNSDVALAAAIVADGLAALPTVRKALISPASESGVIFVGGIVNGTIALLAARRIDAAHIAFPLYILLLNFALAVIMTRGARTADSDQREICVD
ncbi:MAG: hypothetical protein M3022_10350 [Actinomycetota bacterium]|nr:hypothetical protein [Actinomycetota bacterium]